MQKDQLLKQVNRSNMVNSVELELLEKDYCQSSQESLPQYVTQGLNLENQNNKQCRSDLILQYYIKQQDEEETQLDSNKACSDFTLQTSDEIKRYQIFQMPINQWSNKPTTLQQTATKLCYPDIVQQQQNRDNTSSMNLDNTNKNRQFMTTSNQTHTQQKKQLELDIINDDSHSKLEIWQTNNCNDQIDPNMTQSSFGLDLPEHQVTVPTIKPVQAQFQVSQLDNGLEISCIQMSIPLPSVMIPQIQPLKVVLNNSQVQSQEIQREGSQPTNVSFEISNDFKNMLTLDLSMYEPNDSIQVLREENKLKVQLQTKNQKICKQISYEFIKYLQESFLVGKILIPFSTKEGIQSQIFLKIYFKYLHQNHNTFLLQFMFKQRQDNSAVEKNQGYSGGYFNFENIKNVLTIAKDKLWSNGKTNNLMKIYQFMNAKIEVQSKMKQARKKLYQKTNILIKQCIVQQNQQQTIELKSMVEWLMAFQRAQSFLQSKISQNKKNLTNNPELSQYRKTLQEFKTRKIKQFRNKQQELENSIKNLFTPTSLE